MLLIKKNINLLILSLVVFLHACSDTNNKEVAVIKGLMSDQNISEKQAKCLIKETKPLVKQTEWNKYEEVWNMINDNLDPDEKDMQTMFNVGFAMLSIGPKCNVIFK